MEELSLYTAIIFVFLTHNLVGFALMARDKGLAKRRKRRIPEKTFFLMAFFGGALGVWLGMQTFRHKTKHLSFKIGIPLLFLLNLGIAYYLVTLAN